MRFAKSLAWYWHFCPQRHSCAWTRRSQLALVALGLALIMPRLALAQRIQFPVSQPVDPYLGPPPTATLDGSIQTEPGFDPYAAQGMQPPALFPGQGPTDTPYQPGTRFLQEIRLENTWLPRFNSNGFGTDDVDLSATFAFPFYFNPAPVLVTPGFTYRSWNGPDSAAFVGSPDLPPRAYDAYLDVAWQPQITTWLSADLGARVGVFSDFNRVNTDSVRVIARGLGVITLSPRWQLTAGVVYLDRLKVKLLPSGGLIWTPNQDTRWDITFPSPKLAQRMTTVGNTDLWWYLAGEYGGGSWTIERTSLAADRIDYNDLRVMLGLEAYSLGGTHSYFEIGYVFDREILYESSTPAIQPSDTLMLRLGLTY